MAFETGKDIQNRFAFHAATTAEKRSQHGSAREAFALVALEMNEKLPEGREKAMTLTKLEEAMFWANAAIARNKG